jgi:hypothetical protein
MPGSSAGQKKAPICTSTCAAHTTATSRAGDRVKLAEMMAMAERFHQVAALVRTLFPSYRKYH